MVTEVAKNEPLYSGTNISRDFLRCRMTSWQAHLTRISPYLLEGDGYKFHDADTDPNEQIEGPQLTHYREASIVSVWQQSKTAWRLETNIPSLPTPYIRVFQNGEYTGRKTGEQDAKPPERVDSDPNPECPTTRNPLEGDLDTQHLLLSTVE